MKITTPGRRAKGLKTLVSRFCSAREKALRSEKRFNLGHAEAISLVKNRLSVLTRVPGVTMAKTILLLKPHLEKLVPVETEPDYDACRKKLDHIYGECHKEVWV